MSDTKRSWSIEKITRLLTGALAKKKGTQSAVSDPTASGTTVEFISGITQNAQGVITPAKKTVRTVSKGNTGLCPALPDENTTTKYLRQDGSWAVPPDTTYESKAAASGGTDVSLVTTGEKYGWNNKWGKGEAPVITSAEINQICV